MLSQSPQIFVYPIVDSTMDEACRIINAGNAESKSLTVVFAESQHQARGRRQRPWFSPPGNFCASFVLPWLHPIQTIGQMSFVYGLAITEALRKYLLPSSIIQCKWPNDILINNAKVGGILLETHTPPQDNTLFLIAGVGINVCAAPESLKGQPPATYLQAHAPCSMTTTDILQGCLAALKKWYNCWCTQGFAPIRETWLEWADPYGKKVAVRLEKQGEPIEGRFVDLDPTGALIFETLGGHRHTLYAGDVFFDGR